MIEIIKNWYNLYTPASFIGHKLTHVIAGILIAGIITLIGYPIVAQIAVLVIAVLKEVTDEYASPGIPISAHVLDVIVTQIGGAIGFGVAVAIQTWMV